MPDNDFRDPLKELEELVDQQIRPLPPPPGTFELITRRARKRRLRRALVTVGSGAAVTACVLVASTNPALLRLSPPAESGQAAAGDSTTGAAPSPSKTMNKPNGSGRRETSPTASSSPASARSTVPGPGRGSGSALAPVPAGFAPSSVTFVSPTRAWVIGQAGTPGSCYNGSICTSVASTSDDGRTWYGEHAPVTSAPGGPNGVSGIRFLDGVNGWAFGPELWATHDGGGSWHSVNTDGQRVTGLETAGNQAYALFGNCSGDAGSGFAAGCTSFTLMTSPARSDAWQSVGPATNDLSAGGAASSAALQVTGSEGYLLAPDGTVYSGPLGGTWAKAGTAPCEPGAAQSSGLPSGALLAAIGPGRLAVVCAGSASRSGVFTSGDGGATWTSAPAAAVSGAPVSLAATPGGTLLLATTGGIYSLASGASRWQPSAAADGSGLPGGGFSYVGMTSAASGVALPADTSRHEIWVTADGGQTWARRSIS